MSDNLAGKPDCPLCRGLGYIQVDTKGPPVKKSCQCILQMDILDNVERGMRRLSKQVPIPESRLLKYTENDMWITASKRWFLPHLRHVALRKPPAWFFKVITDADLMTAWLSSAVLKGQDILDPDALALAPSLRFLTLVDLVDPPHLLVIRVGVKAARNVAMSEVLLETLMHRAHEGKPVWLWDTPSYPLQKGHLCHSSHVEEFLSDYGRIKVPQGLAATSDQSVQKQASKTRGHGGSILPRNVLGGD